jgi:hypothetical protein
MNVEIGAEAALFPEKEYISGIFVAVQSNFFLVAGPPACDARGDGPPPLMRGCLRPPAVASGRLPQAFLPLPSLY